MFEFEGTTNQRSALPAELWPQLFKLAINYIYQ